MWYCEALDRLPTKVAYFTSPKPAQILYTVNHRNGSPRYLYIGNDFGVIPL